jgi:hypothetical protein
MLITNSLAEVVLGPVNIALCGSFVDIAGCKQRLIEIEEIKCCQHGVSKVSPGLPFQWRKGKCIKNACRNARVCGIRKWVRRSKTPKIEGSLDWYLPHNPQSLPTIDVSQPSPSS